MKPFPWKCRSCREVAVTRATVPYETDVCHDGIPYHLTIPSLDILRCDRCGAIVLDDAANERISAALRAAARLLAPEEIRRRRGVLGLTPAQLGELVGVREEVVVRWEEGAQIQQHAMDRLLRGVFDVPPFRHYLGAVAGVPAEAIS